MARFSAAGLHDAPVNTVLDEGPYLVKISKLAETVSKEKKTPGLEFEMIVLQGPIQQNGSQPTGKHIFGNIWISASGQGRDIALQRLAKLCKACDVEQSDDLELDEFLGKEIVIRGKHRAYNGEPQFEVVDFKKPSQG